MTGPGGGFPLPSPARQGLSPVFQSFYKDLTKKQASIPHFGAFFQVFCVDKTSSLCYILITLLEVLFLAKALEYKGHPLQRKDNIIYYGSFADKYIIQMQILDTRKVKDLDVATKVSVQLQLTDPSIKTRDKIVKKSEKDSLYAAIDVAAVWLDRALASR